MFFVGERVVRCQPGHEPLGAERLELADDDLDTPSPEGNRASPNKTIWIARSETRTLRVGANTRAEMEAILCDHGLTSKYVVMEAQVETYDPSIVYLRRFRSRSPPVQETPGILV